MNIPTRDTTSFTVVYWVRQNPTFGLKVELEDRFVASYFEETKFFVVKSSQGDELVSLEGTFSTY